MKIILIIDDQKRWQDIISDCTVEADDIQSGKTLVVYARKYYDGIFYLRTYKGLFAEVHIDYELGYGLDAETGMDVLEWLEKNPACIPASMNACSGNWDNAKKMQEKMDQLLKVKP